MKATRTTNMRFIQNAYRKSLRKETDEPVNDMPAGIGRRAFLINTALAAVAISLPFSCRDVASKKHSVVIIGAGIAGLNAAHTLMKLGIKPVIYEASDRTGGRIFTEYKSDGLTRELGAEFIDSNHYDMLSLADEFGLGLLDCGADNMHNGLEEHFFYYGQQKRTEQDIIAEFEKIKGIIGPDKEKAESLISVSLTDYLEKLRDKIQPWFYDLLYWSFTAEFGLPAEEQTCMNFIDMIDTDTEEGFKIFGASDERFKIAGGNSAIIKAIVEALKKNGVEVRHNSKVVGISKDGNGYKVSLGYKTVSADSVLITIPFTMLRNVEIDPALNFPVSKMKIIRELGYGTNCKLIFETTDRFWRTKKSSGYLFNDVIHNGWDNSQLQSENKGPGGYTVFLGGKPGRDLQQGNNKELYLPVLKDAFKISGDEVNPDSVIFHWPTNKYVMGSYACYKTGQWDLTEEMKAPVGNIFFAGEHCSAKSQGFMNGGAETGRVAAEMIVAAMMSENV